MAAVGVAAGAGAYGYYQGNYVTAQPAEFGETYQATKLALADLAMPIRHESHQGMTGEIESSIADGTHVTINLEEKPRIMASDGHQTEVDRITALSFIQLRRYVPTLPLYVEVAFPLLYRLTLS